MPINIVSSLDSGKIASLLEVFAIFLGLLIAANLQAIVSLAARRRLYSRGTARLCDSTWNLGVLQGFTNPRRLLRDPRALLAFILAVGVICLEVLTVLETKSSKSCAFGASSTWSIQKSSEKCFSRSPEIESRLNSYLASKFVHTAQGKAQEADLSLGIPINTNVFEDSIISGKAVKQLREGNYAELYTAPVVDVFANAGEIRVLDGVPVAEFNFRSGPENVYNITTCTSEQSGEERSQAFPREVKFMDYEKNRSTLITSSSGFVEVWPCHDEFLVRVCDYVGGPKELSVYLNGAQRTFEVECKGHVISREGRRTDAHSMVSLLYGYETIDTSSIRRAVLASLIAQNSASTAACRRYIAAPKKCTQIGWVSLCAVLLLMGLFVLTCFARLGLRIASRDAANFNGSPQMLAETLFNQLEGPERRSFEVPGKRKKKELILGPRLREEDIHMSVLKSSIDPDSYHLVWTRGPLPEGAIPAARIPSREIVSQSNKAEQDVEVSLV